MDARNETAPIAVEADDRDGLRANNLAKAFKGRQVVKDVSLRLKRGEDQSGQLVMSPHTALERVTRKGKGPR